MEDTCSNIQWSSNNLTFFVARSINMPLWCTGPFNGLHIVFSDTGRFNMKHCINTFRNTGIKLIIPLLVPSLGHFPLFLDAHYPSPSKTGAIKLWVWLPWASWLTRTGLCTLFICWSNTREDGVHREWGARHHWTKCLIFPEFIPSSLQLACDVGKVGQFPHSEVHHTGDHQPTTPFASPEHGKLHGLQLHRLTPTVQLGE